MFSVVLDSVFGLLCNITMNLKVWKSSTCDLMEMKVVNGVCFLYVKETYREWQ